MIIKIQKTYKYRIYPARSQISNMENQFSMLRHLYNWNLADRIEHYKNTGETIAYNTQQNNLPHLKIERPWYKGIYSQVLQDCLKRLDKAYQNFFRRVKKGGEKPGFPKFKKRGQWNSLTYPQYSKRPDNKISIPKVGDIKISYHREIPKDAKIKTLTITKEGCKWFACFSVDQSIDIELKQDLTPSIGIDLGLIDFLYASDGTHITAPKYFRKLQKKLAKLQRRFAEAKKRSSKWYKLLTAIQKCHYRIKCQRKDFTHKTANDLLNKSNVVIYEKLNIKNMSRKPKPKQDEGGKYLPNGASRKAGLNKSISDVGWNQFLSILKYKAIEQGKQAIGINPRFTSQICSSCGEIVKKSLSERTHTCSCGCMLNRDHNASLNILAIGLDSLAAQAA